MITFDQVSKRYPSGQDGLKDIEFTMAKGEMAFLTGHSGAGKSTLLKLVARIERPTSGNIFVDDFDLKNIRAREIPLLRRRLGIILQNPRLLKDRTVYDNIALPLDIAGLNKHDIARRVRAALDKVGLLHKEKRYPEALSCGEQQRVGIARAVVNKPTVIIADEPTGNLDPDLAREIMTLFMQFNQVGVSVIVASHDLNLINTFSQRMMVLHHGNLVKDIRRAHEWCE